MRDLYIKSVLLQSTKIASKIQRRYLKNEDLKQKNKGWTKGAIDIVTAADIAVEDALREYFAKELSDYNIFGEEHGAEYDGNGKVIIIDPIDCTVGFVNASPSFGSIISIYNNGKCTGGLVSNTLQGYAYVSTKQTGFEKIDLLNSHKGEYVLEDLASFDPKKVRNPNAVDRFVRFKEEKDMIYLGGGSMGFENELKELAKLVEQEFPNKKVRMRNHSVTNKCLIYENEWSAYFHPGISLHDMSNDFLFGDLTQTLVTDHHGNAYAKIDEELEVKKYATGKSEVIYSNPLIIAKPEVHARFLPLLDKFMAKLDEGQKIGNNV